MNRSQWMELRLTNHHKMCLLLLWVRQEYLLCWKENRKKIYWNSWECLHSLLKAKGKSWGSKEGHWVQSRVCVETTFCCQLANVSVTVLSAVFLHFINEVSSSAQLREDTGEPASSEQFSTSAKSNALAAAVTWKGTTASTQLHNDHEPLWWQPMSQHATPSAKSWSLCVWCLPGLSECTIWCLQWIFTAYCRYFPSIVIYGQMRKKVRYWKTYCEKNILHGKYSFDKCNCIVIKILTMLKICVFYLEGNEEIISFWHMEVLHSRLYHLKDAFIFSRNILKFLCHDILYSLIQREKNFTIPDKINGW